jgi:hypothetical protein
MKHIINPAVALALVLALTPTLAFAEDDPLAQQETQLQEETKKPGYTEQLKTRYNLTDDQLKALRDKGMNDSQITMAAQLAQSSNKPIDDIVKMRLEDKMGWGKIAKELGVHPGEIGKGISSMHNGEKKEARMEEKKDKMQARADKREERKAKQEAKKEAKADHKKH